MTVDEILIMVDIALDMAPVSSCYAGDANGDGVITIDEILVAVNHALSSCPLADVFLSGPARTYLQLDTAGMTATTEPPGPAGHPRPWQKAGSALLAAVRALI